MRNSSENLASHIAILVLGQTHAGLYRINAPASILLKNEFVHGVV